KAASDFSLARNPYAGPPPVIPSGLPAELLARRPDIAEAERYVAAANAEIGIAKTAALPHLSLTGLAGFESTNMASLFSWQNGIYAQAALMANQRTATQIGGQQMVATVVLIKALGGGWLGVPAQPGINANPGARASTSGSANQPSMAKGMTK